LSSSPTFPIRIFLPLWQSATALAHDMALACKVTAILLSSVCVRLVSASSFLSRAQEANVMELTPELEASILQEIEAVLGSSKHGLTEERLMRIEDMMRATFKSLPKNQHDRLSHVGARYTLHSYFVQRHAWFVRGISSLADNSSAATPSNLLQDKVEDYVQAAFEQRMGAQGLDLKDMAVLAATYENLVHGELAQRLDATFHIMSMTGKESMTVETLDKVMDVYMMGYILNLNYTVLEPYKLELITGSIHKIYPTWPSTKEFLRSVRTGSTLHRSYFSRSDAESLLEQVFDQYGRWQDRECQDLKSQLLALEDRSIGVNGSGRVKITDFYGSALRDGNWQFSENSAYLAQNGALDTHGADRVIIANYINSPSNCLASSKFYSVCCINECEDLMDHIEHRFAAPSATPVEIVMFIASLGSSTVAAGRALNDVLVQRLGDIAARNDGQVPLHGRLFAQWLHHAYPRECPYPHAKGTTRPQTVSDYMAQTKQSPVLTKDVMMSVVKAADVPGPAAEASEEVTQWTHHEEMYVGSHVSSPAPAQVKSGVWHSLRPVVYIAVMVATLAALLQRTATGVSPAKKSTYSGKDLFV